MIISSFSSNKANYRLKSAICPEATSSIVNSSSIKAVVELVLKPLDNNFNFAGVEELNLLPKLVATLLLKVTCPSTYGYVPV